MVRYAQALRAHWVLIAVLVLLAGASAAAYSFTATKRYEASADILVSPLQTTNDAFQGFSLFRQSADGSSTVVTAARVMGSAEIYKAAYGRLGRNGHGVSVSVSPLSQADIVAINAVAPSGARAANAANTFAQVVIQKRSQLFQQELTQRIRQLTDVANSFPAASRNGNFAFVTLQQNLGTLRSFVGVADPTLKLLTPASVPSSPSWPRPTLSILVSLVAGLLLGGGLAVAFEVANPRISREEELKLRQRLPILARIPRLPGRAAREHLSAAAPLPAEAWTSYRTLRAVLGTAGTSGGYPESVLVTSATPGDGKTMTAANLSITLAGAGMRVTLVDADFYRPMIGSMFNIVGHTDGVMRAIDGSPSAMRDALVAAPGHPGLHLLLSRPEQAHHFHTLDTGHFKRMLQTLATESDIVIIDSPPLPEAAETLAIADAAEVVLVSVRLGHTRRDKLDELRDLLGRRGIAPLGFVVTTRQRPQAAHYAYGSVPPKTVERLTAAGRASGHIRSAAPPVRLGDD